MEPRDGKAIPSRGRGRTPSPDFPEIQSRLILLPPLFADWI